MRVFCPKCNAQIDSKDFNVTENICTCHSCNELFKLSEIQDQDTTFETEKLLRNPPKGAWVKKDIGGEKIGISTCSKNAIFLFLFTLSFSGISFLGFFQVIQTKSIIGILFMLVFAAVSIFLWEKVFFSIFGKIEFVTNKNGQDYIFSGIGSIGKKHILKWPSIKSIHEQTSYSSEGGADRKIFIEGEKTIKLPINGINEDKTMFLLRALKYYKDIKDRFQQFR
jgi:hypothetical protein